MSKPCSLKWFAPDAEILSSMRSNGGLVSDGHSQNHGPQGKQMVKNYQQSGLCPLEKPSSSGAFYEELSFTNGDTSWQPRLRVLFAMEYLYKKSPIGKETPVRHS